jgi:hypothetical protein
MRHRDARAQPRDNKEASRSIPTSSLRGACSPPACAPQSVDAVAMIYMAVTLVWLLIALRFVNPTQLVSRVKEHPQGAF